MKKIIVVLMALAMFMGVLTGCSDNTKNNDKDNDKDNVKNETIYNEEYNREEMTTISGKKVSVKESDNAFADKELGFGFITPDSWNNLSEEGVGKMVEMPVRFYFSYTSSKIIEKVKDTDSQDISDEEKIKIARELFEQKFNLLCIYRANDNTCEESVSELDKELQEKYSEKVLLGTIGEDKFYLYYNTEMPSGDLSDKDKEDIKAMIDGMDEFKNNIFLFPPKDHEEKEHFEGSLNKFTTTDVNGNEVTQDIFKDYDVTMVNIWTTWCGFCVEEMPELAKLYDDLPENVNMITICGDAADDLDLTKEILDSSNAKFVTLKGNEELKICALDYVTGFPTTVFVDKNGVVIGEPLVGAPGKKSEVIEGYKKLINDTLSKIGK